MVTGMEKSLQFSFSLRKNDQYSLISVLGHVQSYGVITSFCFAIVPKRRITALYSCQWAERTVKQSLKTFYSVSNEALDPKDSERT